jgi:hypothetical protein
MVETNLQRRFVREMFVMLQPIKLIAALLVFPLSAFLTSCESKPQGGNATSKGEVTDPNASFSRSEKNAR